MTTSSSVVSAIRRRLAVLPIPLLVYAATPSLSAQGGSLTPPGPPGVTMKTLDEIEPRSPLQDGVSGVDATDPDYEFVITQQGSYYLTGHLHVWKSNGIKILTTGVTLDLNGFRIYRSGGDIGVGIEVGIGADLCIIKQGFISGFESGLLAIDMDDIAVGGLVQQITVSNCSTEGIRAGYGWKVDGCEAARNGGYGIHGGDGATILNCSAYENSGHGIKTWVGTTVLNCNSTGNQGLGIQAGPGSVLDNCTAYYNSSGGIETSVTCTVLNCNASYNDGTGIVAGDGSTLRGCSVKGSNSSSTESAGIWVGEACVLSDCTSVDNKNDPGISPTVTTGMGIRAGRGSVLSNTTARNNTGYGILLGDEARIGGCTATANGANTNASGISTGFNVAINSTISSSNGGHGFLMGSDSTLTNCQAVLNDASGFYLEDGTRVTDCSAGGNDAFGFRCDDRNEFTGCISRDNGVSAANPDADGFHVSLYNRLVDCVATTNQGDGIEANSNRNYISGCLVRDNRDYGIKMASTANFVIKNYVGANTVGQITPDPGSTGIGDIAPVSTSMSSHSAATPLNPFSNFD